ncbi:retinol dehydrogenase 8 isoform X3 [Alligator mississippiensis]|uniref:retinol dehydrogenase 8 isoform X3 n=1 Tax=Alligator mississippiensis TaxID=8496 RepID=UPI0006ECC098|nr:retinol dehydrogenase 8 isoform X3 [Alligator mississippiensis]
MAAGHRTVLITGCSSGIGLHLAARLAADPRQRFQVIATMRDVGRREPLERAAGAALGRTLSIRRLDVCSDESVAECLRGLPGGPDVLGVIFNDIYAASKFAVEGFCESLAIQLLHFNIHVSLVEPGPVHTAFEQQLLDEASHRDFPDTDPTTLGAFRDAYVPATRRLFAALGQSPEDVVEAVVRVLGAARPPLRTQTNRGYKVLVALKRVDPSGTLSVHASHHLLFSCGGRLLGPGLRFLQCLACGCCRPQVVPA